MSGADIKLTDWERILFGDVPASYYLEAVFRAAFIFVVLLVSMRLLGRRMASQLSQTEFAALVSLAAAVGIPLLTPDRGLIIAVVIAVVIVSIGRFTARLSAKSPKLESVLQGDVSVVVDDGRLMIPAMWDARLSRERVFAQLRSRSIASLGQVRRLYLEATGEFSIVREEPPKPGLSLLPDWDHEFVEQQRKRPEVQVCSRCGHRFAENESQTACPNCGDETKAAAVE